MFRLNKPRKSRVDVDGTKSCGYPALQFILVPSRKAGMSSDHQEFSSTYLLILSIVPTIDEFDFELLLSLFPLCIDWRVTKSVEE